MTQERKIQFNWEHEHFIGLIEKEYENSYLVVVTNPTPNMEEKYTNRMIISKKCSQFVS